MSLDPFDDFAESFRRSGGDFSADLRFEAPERFNFARDVLDHLASDGDKLAIWWIGSGGAERKVTFAEIAEQSRRACNLLTEQGVGQGDVVVVLSPEGRMKRKNGLDKHGRPMTVRGGIGDILDRIDRHRG